MVGQKTQNKQQQQLNENGWIKRRIMREIHLVRMMKPHRGKGGLKGRQLEELQDVGIHPIVERYPPTFSSHRNTVFNRKH